MATSRYEYRRLSRVVRPSARSSVRRGGQLRRFPVSATLRIVRGAPTPEELAVVAALVTAAAAAGPAPAPRVRRGGWNDPAARHRRTLLPGPNAWRASVLPR